MAILFLDSFDHYATADVEDKWSAVSNTPTIATGRNGNGMNTSGSNRWAALTVSPLGTFVIGFAFQFTAGLPSSDIPFLTVVDSGTAQIEWRLTSTGLIRVTRNGTSIALGTTVLPVASWVYFETKFTISDAPSGVVITKINEVVDINESTLDTRNAGTTIDTIRVGVVGVGVGSDPHVIDDFYLVDTTGGSPTNDFLGDIRVQAIFPNGNGNSSQLVGSDSNSTDNYLLVDETTTVNDADYVQSSTATEKDTYAYGNVTPTTGTVYAVQPVPRALKTDAGARSIVSVARLSGTETDSSNNVLSQSALYYPDVRETKPGGGAWTISDVNSAEFGIKVA